MKIWLTAQQCVGLPGLPPVKSQIETYFKKQIDATYLRRLPGKNHFECNLIALPLISQIAFLKKNHFTMELAPQTNGENYNYDSEQLWGYVETASSKQLEKAQIKCQIVLMLEKLLYIGMPKMRAFMLSALMYNHNVGSIQRWYYATRHYQRVDYLPALLNKYSKPSSIDTAKSVRLLKPTSPD